MLSRRWVINCVLIVLIAGLAWAGLRLDNNSSAEKRSGISKLSPADIDRLEIQAGESRLKLARDADSWNIDYPINWPAQDASIGRILSILNADARPLGNAADVDLAALGLEPPTASLRFNDTRLLFGATNNIGERRYVMIDSKLYLLPDIHLAFITQGLAGMVDRRLLPPRYRIASLRLPEFEIERDGDNGWRSSHDPDFSQDQLKQLIDNWLGLQASRIKRFDNGASAGQRVEIRLTDGREIDFLVISTAPEVVIANPQIGLQYHFRSVYLDQLLTIRSTENGG